MGNMVRTFIEYVKINVWSNGINLITTWSYLSGKCIGILGIKTLSQISEAVNMSSTK